MSDNSFHFTFEGPAFEDHEIDVADLAPALLALGKIVQEANRVVNGKRADARLKMKASQEGSFDAILTIDISILKALGDLIAHHKDRITDAKELTDLLINVKDLATWVAGGGVGLFAALKLLRGRRADRIDDIGNGTSVIVNGGQNIVVDNRTILLLQDPEVREAAADFGAKLGKIRGLDRVRFNDRSDRGEEVVIEKGDLPSLRVPELTPDEEQISKTERHEWLKIVTAPFRDGYVWRFSDGGEKTFTAEVRDLEFVQRVASGEVALSANDALFCLILEEQRLSREGLKKETVVMNVLEYRPGARQIPLI